MHMPLAPSLAAQGRVTEANAAARVLALQPDFTIDKHCADVAVLATLAGPAPGQGASIGQMLGRPTPRQIC